MVNVNRYQTKIAEKFRHAITPRRVVAGAAVAAAAITGGAAYAGAPTAVAQPTSGTANGTVYNLGSLDSTTCGMVSGALKGIVNGEFTTVPFITGGKLAGLLWMAEQDQRPVQIDLSPVTLPYSCRYLSGTTVNPDRTITANVVMGLR